MGQDPLKLLPEDARLDGEEGAALLCVPFADATEPAAELTAATRLVGVGDPAAEPE